MKNMPSLEQCIQNFDYFSDDSWGREKQEVKKEEEGTMLEEEGGRMEENGVRKEEKEGTIEGRKSREEMRKNKNNTDEWRRKEGIKMEGERGGRLQVEERKIIEGMYQKYKEWKMKKLGGYDMDEEGGDGRKVEELREGRGKAERGEERRRDIWSRNTRIGKMKLDEIKPKTADGVLRFEEGMEIGDKRRGEGEGRGGRNRLRKKKDYLVKEFNRLQSQSCFFGEEKLEILGKREFSPLSSKKKKDGGVKNERKGIAKNEENDKSIVNDDCKNNNNNTCYNNGNENKKKITIIKNN